MIAFVLALMLAAPPKVLKPRPFQPIDMSRGKVTLPVLGLELDLTPAAGGRAGASWHLRSEVGLEDGSGVDRLEVRLGDQTIATFAIEVIVDNDCVSRWVDTPVSQVTTVAGTWSTWRGIKEGGLPGNITCRDGTSDYPTIYIARTWRDPAFALPAADDPVLSAVSFALRDARFGAARPLVDAHAQRTGEAPRTLVIGALGTTIDAPRDGALWLAAEDQNKTVVRRALPFLPRTSITIQHTPDPAACPAKLRRGQWGALGPTLRCRPLKDGALLVELSGPTELATPILDELAKITSSKASR